MPATARWPNTSSLPMRCCASRRWRSGSDRAAIARLTEPANYLGSADGFIDRVLAAARAGS